MLLIFALVRLLLPSVVSPSDVPCSHFGRNWSAEIRCLRAQLSQCKRAVNSRGIRTVDPYSGYSYNYIELPSATLSKPDTNFAGLSRQVDEKLITFQEKIGSDVRRQVDHVKHRCEREQRNSEARFDRLLTHLQLKHDKDIRALTKRMELLTSRVFKRGEYEYISVLTRKSWYDAEEDCIAWGGHLVSVVDKEENDFVRGLLRAESSWIGLNDVQRENVFVNTDMAPASFRNFRRGEFSASGSVKVENLR
ncbi:unnamed protein product [Nippostrongylus brasiliensis]|uniref:C-type lectin domain-containing protein n=1 Tax=Nippostrongylus brasiliensis TaxID=27835 RepID=A0A158R039_NIPBR|nr:unnamed protein product [Nippostrongylus brasiliensis]